MPQQDQQFYESTAIPQTSYPKPPAYLQPEGQARWNQIAFILDQRGTWTNDWCPILEQLCLQFQLLAAIDEAIQKQEQGEGFPLLIENRHGIKTNPILEYRLSIHRTIVTCLAELKLTPRSDNTMGAGRPSDSNSQVSSGILSRPRLVEFDDFEATA